MLCDGCATAIPNLHFHCPEPTCGWDLCVRCRAKGRQGLQQGGGAKADGGYCPNHAKHVGGQGAGEGEGVGGRRPAAAVAAAEGAADAPMQVFRFFDDGRLEILRKVRRRTGRGLGRGKEGGGGD